MSNKTEYVDINTGKVYNDIPEGAVQPYIVNGQPVTEQAYNAYHERYPEQLDEIVIYPQKQKSDTMGAYYDRMSNLTEKNFLRSLNTKYDANRIRRANHWSGISNMLSPSQYFGAIFDYAQRERPFWESIWYGNSGFMPDNFARENPRTSTLLNMFGDTVLGIGGSKFYSWGTESRFHYGNETPIVETTYFSPKVTKHSMISPSEMHVRNNTTGFVKSSFKGTDADGLYIYTQPKMWFPKNPKVAFNRILNNAVKKGYEVISHPNLQGPALLNKRFNRVISDFGETGRGQVGWTWRGPGFSDAAFETIPEFMIAMEKNGGKLIIK